MHSIGQQLDVRIEIKDSPLSILIVFDRKADIVSIPWQDCWRLADVMDQVIEDLKKDFPKFNIDFDAPLVIRESSQIAFNQMNDGLVHLITEWTDRVKFTSLEAFVLVVAALRKKTQEAEYAQRGVHFVNNKRGMIKEIVNTRLGYTQKVR